MVEASFASLGSRRRVAVLAFAVLAAAITLAAVQVAGMRSVLGSGGGGLCAPTSGSPACTVKANNAFVDFQSVSADGCVYTDATVEAFQAISMPGRVPGPAYFVFISAYDNCAGTLIEAASNIDPGTSRPVFDGSAQFSPTLDTASLSGTATMFDETTGAQAFFSTVDVTWKAYGPTTTYIDSFHSRTPGVIVTSSHSNSSTRNAEAQGLVTDVNSNNFASPSLNALVQNSVSGSVVIVKS